MSGEGEGSTTARDAAYTFGQDDPAARRLRVLHEVFGPTSRALLAALRPLGPFERALDLGCGPGCTTALLAEILGPRHLLGIDVSDAFLDRARLEVPGATFACHDLRRPPYPGAPADLIYARYVVGHLGDVEGWMRTWSTQLAGTGLLVVEDNEWIAPREPTFARYLELAREAMDANQADLYPGPRLADAAGRLQVEVSRVAEVSPATAVVAGMFRLNLGSWGRRAAAFAHAGEVARLGRELARLQSSSARGEITWGIRQLAVRRAGDGASGARRLEKPIRL